MRRDIPLFTGTVTLSAVFKETGEIGDITVINSLPNGLTEKAMEADEGHKIFVTHSWWKENSLSHDAGLQLQSLLSI